MDLEQRIENDFSYLLNFIKNVYNNFVDNPEQKELFNAWMEKLCCEIYVGIPNKRKRNMYMCKLLMSAEKKRLTGVFLKRPPAHGLPDLGQDVYKAKKPAWIKNLVNQEKEFQPRRRNEHKTYLSTKLLQNNQGAVAYLAVSAMPDYRAQHEDEWAEMGTGNYYQLSEAQDKYQVLAGKLVTASNAEESVLEESAIVDDFDPPVVSTPKHFARVNKKVYIPDELLGLQESPDVILNLINDIECEFHGRAKPGDVDLLEYEFRKLCEELTFSPDEAENMTQPMREKMLLILRKKLYRRFVFGKDKNEMSDSAKDW